MHGLCASCSVPQPPERQSAGVWLLHCQLAHLLLPHYDCRDTGTFFDASVGFSCSYRGPYMAWSGDNTGYGGMETVRVNLDLAHSDGFFATAATVVLRAGWFDGAGGSGPATVAVSFVRKGSQERRCTQIKPIAPGRQSGCSSTAVETVAVTASGSPGQETLSFSFSPIPECSSLLRNLYCLNCGTDGYRLTCVPGGGTMCLTAGVPIARCADLRPSYPNSASEACPASIKKINSQGQEVEYSFIQEDYDVPDPSTGDAFCTCARNRYCAHCPSDGGEQLVCIAGAGSCNMEYKVG